MPRWWPARGSRVDELGSDVDADDFGRTLQERVARAYDPDPSMLADTRARVMAVHAAYASEMNAPTPRPFPRRRLVPAAIALGAILALGGAVAAASGPGQVFYGVRLAAEALTLPPESSASRIPSELDRLDARLAEVQAAAGPHDLPAFRDALAAYLEELRSVSGEPGLDAAAARVQAVLATHVTVLTGLLTVVPAEARPWIEEALDQVDRLIARSPTSHPSNPPAGGSVPAKPPAVSASPAHASPRPIASEVVPLPSVTPSHRPEHSRGP